jgi:hypothetical protein
MREVIYEGHLEDGRFEIRKDNEGYYLHVWSWWTPSSMRTNRWKEEGDVTEISKDDVDIIIERYRKGKIRVVNQLFDHQEPPMAVDKGEWVTGDLLREESDSEYIVRLVKGRKDGLYYVVLTGIVHYLDAPTEYQHKILFKSENLRKAEEFYVDTVKRYLGKEISLYWG